MKLVLLSPKKVQYDGEVDSVTIPGTGGSFTVLPHHAPLITTIEKGIITYVAGNVEHSLQVTEGFAEVKNNVVYVCIENVISE